MSMHEEQLKDQHPTGQERYEREDMGPAGVFYFMVGLAIVGTIVGVGGRWA